jgi:hypothetical protein
VTTRRERDVAARIGAVVTALYVRLLVRDDRGDVPGWVLITVMTAGLVSGLWVLAGPKLGSIFSNAMDSVTGP